MTTYAPSFLTQEQASERCIFFRLFSSCLLPVINFPEARATPLHNYTIVMSPGVTPRQCCCGGIAVHKARWRWTSNKTKPIRLPICPFAYFDDVETCTIPILPVNLIFDYVVPKLHIIFMYFMNHFCCILKHHIESAGKVEIQKSWKIRAHQTPNENQKCPSLFIAKFLILFWLCFWCFLQLL